MPQSHSALDLGLEGPAGVLEARLDEVTEPRGIAVLCHPHPRYGGSMQDPVLASAARVLMDAGLSCLRFNFRGVGRSDGHHDDGKGEIEDVLTALSAARARQSHGPLWLVGYSFGACMAWAAARRQPPHGLILIAAPVGLMDFSGGLAAEVAVHALHGDRDDFAAVASVEQWASALEPKASVHVIHGADHFFRGQESALDAALTAALAQT